MLDDADLDVTVYDREPGPGFDMESVVIYIITCTNQGAGLGSSDFHESWRVQLSIYHTDVTECGELAVKVSDAILAAVSTLEETYGLKKLTKIQDTDMGRADPNMHEFQIVQGYAFETDSS